MLSAALALLMVGSVEVRLEDARGLSSDDVRTITTSLAEAIEARTKSRVTVARKSPCGQDSACVQRLLTEGSSTDLVFLRLIGVPTRIRLIADRAGREEARAEVDLSRTRGSWAMVLGGVAERLFPAPPPPPPKITVAPPPPPLAPPPPPPPVETESAYGPWLLAGAGAAVLIAGTGFGISSRTARSSAAEEPHTPAELADLEDRAVGHGIAANVMFGVGGAGVVAGLIWLLVE